MADDRVLVRMPDGQVVRVKRGTPKDEIVRKYERAKATRADLKQRGESWFAPVDSFVRGAADTFSLGTADGISAGLSSVNPFGRNSGWRDGWRNAYNANVARERAIDKFDEKNNPKSRFFGQVAGAVLPAFVTGGGSLAAAPRALTTGAKIARVAKPTALAAAQGGAYAFGSAEGGFKDRIKAVPEGAAWGAGGDLAGRLGGKIVSRALGGRTLSDAQRALADEGVLMTPGMRGGRVSRFVEDKVMGSVPGLSDLAELARGRSSATLRQAAANRVLAPIGRKADEITTDKNFGNAFAGRLNEAVYDAYDNTLSNLSLQLDDGLRANLDDVVNRASGYLDDAEMGVLRNNIANVTNKLEKGPVTGQRLRETVQELRGNSAALGGTGKGAAVREVSSVVEDALDLQNSVAAGDAYRKARESVSLLKRYEDAASRAGTQSGEFGPTQLFQAASKRGYGTNNANIADGTAPMLELANNAREVMRIESANSGSVPRALTAGGLLGMAPAVDPLMGGLLAAKSLGYVPGIDELLQNIAVNRPAWARGASNAIDNNSRALGLLGVGSALGLSQ